ncbi:universal stress protein [Mucilaginibacter jinjuensis]|uniref:Universal stress protein n=1 Tax=Mucilaginibacter jinjuensis TaxID=1176721 RepID=A0ABY7TDF4_9SPHI|nr:universal stress protein [Mucilaginibacter jinjuensis]WCT14555.1 universal stress protein [Mucilaginibacter jinjuensis]
MKTVLIPVDSSATAANTIAYAAEFCKYAPVDRIILLSTYYSSVYTQYLPSADFVQLSQEDMDRERTRIKGVVDGLCDKLTKLLDKKVKVQVAITEEPIVRSIKQINEQEKPNLIIAGSDGNTYVEHSSINKLLINIARTSTVSVLIVPVTYQHKPVDKVVLAVDFKAVLNTELIGAIEERYNWFHPEIMVLNVDASKNPYETDEERRIVEEKLGVILKNFDYKVYYVQDRNILRGITTFADEHQANLIIALPGKHSFFYNLTHNSITEGLYNDATQPVLILK